MLEMEQKPFSELKGSTRVEIKQVRVVLDSTQLSVMGSKVSWKDERDEEPWALERGMPLPGAGIETDWGEGETLRYAQPFQDLLGVERPCFGLNSLFRYNDHTRFQSQIALGPFWE